MATNIPTIEGLKRMTRLIDSLHNNSSGENMILDEIRAWNKILKLHLGQQQKQQGLWEKDYYVYNEDTKKVIRMKDKRRG
jgi:hypothetical protein